MKQIITWEQVAIFSIQLADQLSHPHEVTVFIGFILLQMLPVLSGPHGELGANAPPLVGVAPKPEPGPARAPVAVGNARETVPRPGPALATLTAWESGDPGDRGAPVPLPAGPAERGRGPGRVWGVGSAWASPSRASPVPASPALMNRGWRTPIGGHRGVLAHVRAVGTRYGGEYASTWLLRAPGLITSSGHAAHLGSVLTTRSCKIHCKKTVKVWPHPLSENGTGCQIVFAL